MLNFILAIVVSASIDSTMLFIGDQTNLHLQAICDPAEQVQMPVYGETLIPDIEIVDRTNVDTVKLDNGRYQLNQTLTITSFKDSLFYIEPLPFVSGGDTFRSQGLSLNVIQPFEVDSSLAITDIKPVAKAPIWWWGIFRWILIIILLAGLAYGARYLALFIGRRKGVIPPARKEPKRPAEEVALEKLDKIKEEKIWQSGQVKEYHTELTDVVREYIGRRFKVSSSEKTSDETLRAMKPLLVEQKELYEKLRKMLSLADLVKFAKWTATPDENELSLKTAYDFVHETTPETPVEEEEPDNGETTETKTKKIKVSEYIKRSKS